MTLLDTPAGISAHPHTIRDATHPLVRRIGDVLRSRTSRPRTIVLDDEVNIDQAAAHGVDIDTVVVAGSVSAETEASLRGRHPGARLERIDDGVLAALFGEQKRARVFALAHAPRPPRLSDLTGGVGDIVVLDGVRLVGNIGAIVRSAVAFGAAAVVLLDSGLRNVADRRLIRASRGLVFAVPVIITTHVAFARFAASAGITTVAFAADAQRPLSAVRTVGGRVALLMGGEREGVSAAGRALATLNCGIAMEPGVESLNVSVVAALALHERVRARGDE